MVKIGFIVEGDSDAIILRSDRFKNYLRNKGIDFVEEIAYSGGNGNLLPQKLFQFSDFLRGEGATHIIILTDLDEDMCITKTKERIDAPADHTIVVSVKAIESWFLADSKTLSGIFKKKYHFDLPEQTPNSPFETLKAEFLIHTDRGIGNYKIRLAKRMIREGFEINNAASHPNCPSSNYFLNKIQEIASGAI